MVGERLEEKVKKDLGNGDEPKGGEQKRLWRTGAEEATIARAVGRVNDKLGPGD